MYNIKSDVKVNYRHRLINCDNCTTLVENVYVCVGAVCVCGGGADELSVPSPQFLCEPKTAPKK